MRKKLLKDKEINSVLDYGINDGHVTNILYGHLPPETVFVSDIENKISAKNNKKNWNFLYCDLDTSKIIEAQDSSFDLISCIHVLEHINNPSNPLKEFRRLLKKSGRLYVETPNTRSLYMPSFTRDRTWNFYDDPTHIRPYSTGALKKLCETNGFKVIKAGIYREWKYALALPISPVISIALRDLRPIHYSLIHTWGWSSFCYCEKI